MVTDEIIDYESLVETFNQALLHTLRKHSVADTFLDYWVPDADPVLGIAGMADSVRIAGHPKIAIRFRIATVPEARLPELKKAFGLFSKVVLEKQGDSVVLRATEMSPTEGEAVARAFAAKSAKPAWQADKVSAAAAKAAPQWDTREFPELADVHPHFRAPLNAVLGALSREGDGGPEGQGLVRIVGRAEDVSLTLDVDSKTHTVRRARHAGATKPSERAALDLFCRAAENLPLQEVADHVGLKVVDSLVDEDKPPPVGGVLLPANAGPAFMLAPRLARQAWDAYRASMKIGNEANFYYAPPSAAWQALSPVDRAEKVAGGVRGFLQSENLYPDDMELLRLEKNKYGYQVRGVVGFSDRIKVKDKPFLLRRLEQRLRRDAKTELELVADRAKDSSPLRRLS